MRDPLGSSSPHRVKGVSVSQQRSGLPGGLETVRLEVDGSVLRVVLDRPEVRNAMNRHMVEELLAVVHHLLAVDCLTGEDALRVVVVQGAGKTFSAGGDVRGMLQGDGAAPGALREVNRAFGTLLERLARIPQVLIVGVEGAAMGGGLGLLSVSDVAIATADATIGTPEVTLGLVPAQIAPFLVRRIGRAQTQRLALTGGRFSADESRTVGLVHQVVPDGEALLQAIEAVVAQVQRCAPKAVARTKWLLSRVGEHSLGRVLDDAADVFTQAALDEAPSGIKAFLDKHPAPWAS